MTTYDENFETEPLHNPETCEECQAGFTYDDYDDFYNKRASRMAGLGIIGAFVVSGLFWWAVFALVTR